MSEEFLLLVVTGILLVTVYAVFWTGYLAGREVANKRKEGEK